MKKIILVEDDKSLIDLYREVFRKTDFDVELAGTAQEMKNELDLIKRGDSEKPDLILLDLMLPDKNGIEVLKHAKRDDFLRNIPIFVLTNYENPNLEKEMVKASASPDRYLIKAQYTPFELVDMIKGYLNTGESERKIRLI